MTDSASRPGEVRKPELQSTSLRLQISKVKINLTAGLSEQVGQSVIMIHSFPQKAISLVFMTEAERKRREQEHAPGGGK